MKKVLSLIIALTFVLSLSGCHNEKKPNQNQSSSSQQELYIDKLEENVKIWANAYYKNQPTLYIDYSTNNATCLEMLGVTDFDSEKKYNEVKQELLDYISYMEGQYEFYYVEAAPSNYEIYDKSSEMYSNYKEKLAQRYSNTDIIDAFALVEIEIRLEYTKNSSNTSESETSNIECMLINDEWYVMV